jgi:MFS family permease
MSSMPGDTAGDIGVDADARRALTLICLSVLLASAPWFSGTAAAADLRIAWQLDDAHVAWLTGSVQLGFVAGTFLFAALNLSDVFRPRHVYVVAALAAASSNLAFALAATGLPSALALRFATGVCLAGVYPVAMKIVASWFRSGLGWRLGLMVGALGIGTATPYLVRAVGPGLPWRAVVVAGSLLGLLGAGLMALVGRDGPHAPARARFEPRVAPRLFRIPGYRWTALGYFGHMGELYCVWGLTPIFLREVGAFGGTGGTAQAATSILWLAFATVAIGALGCAAGGWISRTIGERRVALVSLCASGLCCLASVAGPHLPSWALVGLFLVWGVTVVADSPQFSALAVRYAPREYVGTALTLQNGIGFLITVGSLQLVPWLASRWGWRFAFAPLAASAFLGAVAMARLGAIERRGAGESR